MGITKTSYISPVILAIIVAVGVLQMKKGKMHANFLGKERKKKQTGHQQATENPSKTRTDNLQC